jgi:hypothetical protein
MTKRLPGQLLQTHKARRFIELELAVRAATAPRHVSFIEQARARPGPGIVARLADALGAFLPADDATADVLRKRAKRW